jgi:hypothetical protein
MTALIPPHDCGHATDSWHSCQARTAVMPSNTVRPSAQGQGPSSSLSASRPFGTTAQVAREPGLSASSRTSVPGRRTCAMEYSLPATQGKDTPPIRQRSRRRSSAPRTVVARQRSNFSVTVNHCTGDRHEGRSPLARLRPRHDDCGSGAGRLHRRACDPRLSRTDPGRLRSGLEDERTRRDPVATGAGRYASDPDRSVTPRGFVATDMESVASGRGREGTDHDRRGIGPSPGPCPREGLRTSRESVASGREPSLTAPGP